MNQANIPFVIFFLERSGSSHLCSLLDSHPQISCGAEEFTTQQSANTSSHEAPRYIHARKERMLDPNETQTRQHLATIFARSEHAAGFKLKYPIQFNRYPEVVQSLLHKRNELRVIHLDRENVLKKFVSKQVLVHQRTSATDYRRSDKLNFKPIQIDLNGILETLNRFELQRKELKKLTEPFEHKLEIEYEQFNVDESGLVKKILEFLQVDSGYTLTSRFIKKTPMAIENSVANYAELVAALEGTRYAEMIRP